MPDSGDFFDRRVFRLRDAKFDCSTLVRFTGILSIWYLLIWAYQKQRICSRKNIPHLTKSVQKSSISSKIHFFGRIFDLRTHFRFSDIWPKLKFPFNWCRHFRFRGTLAKNRENLVWIFFVTRFSITSCKIRLQCV